MPQVLNWYWEKVIKTMDKDFYHPDHLGSTSLTTNQSGGIVEVTSYSPYGEIIEGGKK